MGRAPCCDKANVKKGPWSPEEDARLKAYIQEHGTGGNWIALPQKIGLRRCGKSCRLRWLNYLRPNIKHGGFSEEEDNVICSLFLSIGSRWSIIAAQLPGRTDNDIKNYWNTKLKKKLIGKQRKGQMARREMMIKRECPNEPNNFMVSEAMMTAISYCPDLPMHLQVANPIPGGKFYGYDQQPNSNNGSIKFQYPFECTPYQDLLLYDMDSMINHGDCSQMPNMFQGINFSSTEQLEGLESYSGVEIVNCSSSGNSPVESNSNWGDVVGSMAYPAMASNYEANVQEKAVPVQVQECYWTFQDSSCFGLQ